VPWQSQPLYGQSVIAQAAARALVAHADLSAADMVKQSLVIAGDLCIYTNQNHTIETLD